MAAQGNHVDGTVGAGLKPARLIAAPVVARLIAAYHMGSWHQRQTDTSVNSAKRREINPVSLYYCDNGLHRRGGFQTRPNHRRARRHSHHHRRSNWLSAERVPIRIQRLCNWLGLTGLVRGMVPFTPPTL